MYRHLTYQKELAPGIILTVHMTERGTMEPATRDEPGGWDCDEVELDGATLTAAGQEIDLCAGALASNRMGWMMENRPKEWEAIDALCQEQDLCPVEESVTREREAA